MTASGVLVLRVGTEPFYSNCSETYPAKPANTRVLTKSPEPKALPLARYATLDIQMASITPQHLEIITGAEFQRLTNALLAREPDYAALIETGSNAKGQTIKSPLDAFSLVPGSSGLPPCIDTNEGLGFKFTRCCFVVSQRTGLAECNRAPSAVAPDCNNDGTS